MSQEQIDKLVKVYVKMRDKKSELAAETKEITAQQEQIETELLRLAHEMGTTGFKTEFGTTFISEETTFSLADDNTFADFVRQTGQVELFQRRASDTAIKQYMQDHDGDVPPGLNWFKRDRMKIRRSTKI